MINIKNLDKAKVLRGLWQFSKPMGMSYLSKQSLGDNGFTINHAKNEVAYLQKGKHALNFFYVYGHVIFCDITNDEFDEWQYDMMCGEGTAQRAINYLRKEEDLMENRYEGPFLRFEIIGSKDNYKIAKMLHESFVGKQDYIDNNVIINKDPDETSGKEKVGVYVCVDDLKDEKDVFDTLKASIKSIQDLM